MVELINLRFLALFRDFKLKIILGTFHTSCSACTKCLSLCKMLNLLVYGVTYASSNFKNLKSYISRWQWHNLRFWQRLRLTKFEIFEILYVCVMVDITRIGNTSSKNVTPNEPKEIQELWFFENLSPLSLEIYLLIKNL